MGKRSQDEKVKPGADFDIDAFEKAVEHFLAGNLKVMPVERDFPYGRSKLDEVRNDFAKFVAEQGRQAIAAQKAKEEAELAEMANQFLNAEMVEQMMRSMKMADLVIEPKLRPKEAPLPGQRVRDAAQDRWRVFDGTHWRWEDTGQFVSDEYKGTQRVQIDVRLGERQIPEAMSNESKVFKDQIKRGLVQQLLRALDATEGMGLVKEDWQVLRQSLVEMIAEQSRLYYRENRLDTVTGKPEATITFEIPKMTMSFRMPLDPGFGD